MNTLFKKIPLLPFLLIGIVSIVVRLTLNFSQELLIGNGGYYPLQVRTILERGELAFTDMPLLFYFDAGIVRVLSFLNPSPSNELIINVVKVVDSISIPLMVIPLYQIFNLSNGKKTSLSILTLTLFAVLSFYTLNLTSSFQKNALGILFLLFTIAWFFKYIKSKSWKHLILTFAFLILIGLTHFGTFAFVLLMGGLFLVFIFKKKAILPLILLSSSALLMIYMFDPVRSSRLLFAWQDFFTKLPAPPQLILSAIYLTIAFFASRLFRKHKESFENTEKAIIHTLIAVLIIIPLPIINPQASDRLAGYLFIPIVLLLYLFQPFISAKFKRIINAVLGLVILGSITFVILMRPPVEVSQKAYEDLFKMKTAISKPHESVVVSRHNLEFWVAWALEVDVSQESKFNEVLINDYNDIYIINQIREMDSRLEKMRNDGNQKRNHFDEPLIPENSVLVYSSEYFTLYQYLK